MKNNNYSDNKCDTCAHKQLRQFSRKSPAAMGSTIEQGITGAGDDDDCAIVPTKYSAIDVENSLNQPSLDIVRLAGVTNSGFGRYFGIGVN